MRNVFLACAALTASTVARAQADNLLSNGDFEMPVAFPNDVQATNQGGGSIGSGGQGDWVAVAGNTYYTQTHFLTGVQSGKMFGNVGLFQQTVAVPNDFDVFTAQVMMLNASNDALKGGEGGFINMDFYDVDGNKLATVTGQEEGSILSANDTQDVWKLVTVTAPALPNTAFVQVDLVAGPFSGLTGAAGGAVFVDDADFEVTGPSAATWLSPTNGSWASNGNWSNSVIPQHTTDHAVFGSVNSSPTTVSLDGNFTVDGLSFDSPNSYSITPGTGGTLTLSATAGSVPLIVNNGNHSISANLTLTSPTVVTVVNSGDSLTLSGAVSFSGSATGTSLTKAGAGTLTMARLNLPSVSVAAGTLKITPNGTSAAVSVVGTLNISASATLDLADNDLLIPYISNITPAAQIRGYLASAYNGGAWNGHGLTSSAAANDASHRTALGYGEATDVGITTFDGQPISGFGVIVKYTYYGDSSLDGKVDLGNDFALFLEGYLGGGSTWELGDYNYDGTVNSTDFQLFIDGFKTQGGQLGSLEDFIEASPLLSTAQKAQFISAVPEPTSLAVISVTALSALLTRRRNGRLIAS
jgi:hypothetical protein